MSPTTPVAEPAIRWGGVGLYLGVGVTGVALAAMAMATFSRNGNSTFSLIGSPIKPTSGAGAAPQGGGDGGGAAPPAAPAADPAAPPKAGPADRKIIYTARLDLVVKSLDDAAGAIDTQLAAHGGRLARSETRSDTGARRTATYTLEVPAAKYRELVAELRKLGVPERDSVDSQDVSDEYQDILLRVRNMKAEEDTLLKLLAERARTVEEVLAIRRQIQPLREAIERAEGRQKYIEAKAAYSTVTVVLREEANYVPPDAPATPTFGERTAQTFRASWLALVGFGQAVALFAVASVPWLPVAVPVGLLGLWSVRKMNTPARPLPIPVPAAAPPAGQSNG